MGKQTRIAGTAPLTTNAMDPVILASARKHGVLDTDMLHAYRHPIRVFQVDDLVMMIGADAAGRLLEVGWSSSFMSCPPGRSS